MGMGMKPVNRLGSTIHDMVDSLKMQSHEHMFQYQDPDTLEMHDLLCAGRTLGGG